MCWLGGFIAQEKGFKLVRVVILWFRAGCCVVIVNWSDDEMGYNWRCRELRERDYINDWIQSFDVIIVPDCFGGLESVDLCVWCSTGWGGCMFWLR